MHDPDNHKAVSRIIEHVDNKAEALQVGFLVKDDNETKHISNLGMGYLIDVAASDVTCPAETNGAEFRLGVAQGEEASE